MKKVVRGRVLDTESATLVKKVTYGEFGDPCGYEETLYVTEDGTYFLYTNGGCESKYTEENITMKYKSGAEKWLAENK
ncbi:MAG: hypothetical protein IKA43_07040 [Clostridia bacterium]|nr:hypothetical protein [Clostridia bacterium]MBR2297141.1 hypothetical protein [Clostridia bacterium]